jgi:ABC-type cobalamin transport system permease subunit
VARRWENVVVSDNHHEQHEPAEPLETEVTGETVNVRRAPRYGRFIAIGAALGIVIALILTFAFPENDEFDRGQVFGFLLLGLGTIGVAFGAAVALIFDRVLSNRSGLAIAEHEQTHHHDDQA